MKDICGAPGHEINYYRLFISSRKHFIVLSILIFNQIRLGAHTEFHAIARSSKTLSTLIKHSTQNKEAHNYFVLRTLFDYDQSLQSMYAIHKLSKSVRHNRDDHIISNFKLRPNSFCSLTSVTGSPRATFSPPSNFFHVLVSRSPHVR